MLTLPLENKAVSAVTPEQQLKGRKPIMENRNVSQGKVLAAAERKIKVLELCKGGVSVRAIASHLNSQGIKCSKSTVATDIRDALQMMTKELLLQAEEVRELELERIDCLWLAHWEKGLRGDIASTWVLIGLSKRRSELIPGMDGAKRKVNCNLTKEELEKMTDEELDRLIEELER